MMPPMEGPNDLLAGVVGMMGYVPEETIALVGWIPGSTEGAMRLIAGTTPIIPTRPAEMGQETARVKQSLEGNGVDEFMVIVFSRLEPLAHVIAHAVAMGLVTGGNKVTLVMIADGSTYEIAPSSERVPYDLSLSAVTTYFAVESGVAFCTQEQMLHWLDPLEPDVDPEQVEAERDTVAETRDEAKWLISKVEAAVPLATDELHRFVLDITTSPRLMAATGTGVEVGRGDQIEFLANVTRRTPDALRSAPATLVAYAGWLNGNPARARLALCLTDPRDGMAALVQEYVEAGVVADRMERATLDEVFP